MFSGGRFLDILRHNREQGCLPDAWAFWSRSDGGLLLQQGKQLNSSTEPQPNSAPAGCYINRETTTYVCMYVAVNKE